MLYKYIEHRIGHSKIVWKLKPVSHTLDDNLVANFRLMISSYITVDKIIELVW